MALAQSSQLYGDSLQPNPSWYILTNVHYATVNSSGDPSSNFTYEAIFTPFFDGKFQVEQSPPTIDSESIRTFARLAQINPSTQVCTRQQDPDPYFPAFNANPQSQNPYRIMSINPLFLTTGPNNELLTEQGTALSVFAGDRGPDRPYDAITYISNSSGDTKFIFESLFNDSNTVFVNPPLLYAGYPYRISSASAVKYQTSDPVCPFRNFLQNAPCENESSTGSWRYINYSTGNINSIGEKQIIAFPGANYNSNGSWSSAGEQFNFPNHVLNANQDNISSTVQYYLIPRNYLIFGGAACASVENTDSNSLQVFMNQVVEQIYLDSLGDCSKTLTTQCYFSDIATCLNGEWYNYCTATNQSCGTCFGKCSAGDPFGSYCRIAADNTPAKPFICGSSPTPEPPSPISPESFWEEWKVWIVGAVIIIIVFFVFMIFLGIFASAKK
jgi:hypothetical protein